MKNQSKTLKLLAALILSAYAIPLAYAAISPAYVQDDAIIQGRGDRNADKYYEFNTGDSPNNNRITSGKTSKEVTIRSQAKINLLNDTVNIGDGNATGDQSLVFDKGLGASNPRIKFNQTDAKLQFANDGTTFKSIGSGGGSGSGINLLTDDNADFEAGLTGWTASAGAFTSETSSNVMFDTKSAGFDAGASGQTVDSASKTIPGGLISGNGTASCWFKTTATDYLLQAYDGTNVLAERTIPALASAQEIGVAFPFPASGSVRLRIRSQSDAAAIYFDNCFIGSSKTQDQSQSSWIAAIEYPVTANCFWELATGTETDFPADTDCPAPTVYGKALAPSTKIPGIRFSSLPPGFYRFKVRSLSRTTINADIGDVVAVSMSDGTSSFGRNLFWVRGLSASDGQGPGNFEMEKEITTSIGDTTFRLTGETGGGSAGFRLDNAQTGYPNTAFRIDVYRFPTQSEQTLRPDQVAWRVDANIVGANPSLGISPITSYTGIENGSLTLSNNSGNGVIAAQIPCSSTNAPTGTTCAAGNESVGVSFTAPAAGDVLACANFATFVDLGGSSGTINHIFQIVETPNNAQTILQEGKSRIQGGHSSSNHTASVPSFPWRVCGTFSFASAGQKTLRLMYEMNSGGSPSASGIHGDGNTSNGQRDIHWEVYPLNVAMPAPLFHGSVVNSGSGVKKIEYATVTCSSSSAIVANEGAWLSSVGNISSGACAITFNGTPFSNANYACTMSTTLGNTHYSVAIQSKTTSGFTIEGRFTAGGSTSALTAYTGDIICIGSR